MDESCHVKIKLVDDGVPISGRNLSVMINCLKAGGRVVVAMKPNGPAV
jgi:hypothetical protein